jgi:hypothetical protein
MWFLDLKGIVLRKFIGERRRRQFIEKYLEDGWYF